MALSRLHQREPTIFADAYHDFQADLSQVMSYDLMNRRDKVTKHHSSVAGSAETIENYLAIGAPPEKINRKLQL
jgi:hypothetical protein